MVTLQRRFNPIYTSFLQLADRIGTPFVVDAAYTLHTPDPSDGWRGEVATAGGGCVIDMGYHLVDMLIWYFGLPDRVYADLSTTARPDRRYDAEDTAVIQFGYDSGLYGSLLLSRFIGPKTERIRVVGSRGIVDLERGRLRRLATTAAGTSTGPSPGPLTGPAAPLAVLGGPKAVTREGPHFCWPPIAEATTAAVLDQLQTSISVYDRSGVIADLETALAAYHGVAHAVLTSSGTAALHAMYATALRPGDEVIVPAYTFFATVTPLLHLGVRPVLADCDADGNLDPADSAARITPRTKAIVVTHLWGIPADMTALTRLADDRGLLLFEDASHAHGAAIGARKVGTFGAAAAFSMNGPKPLSAGEGGFVLTDDDETYYRVLLFGQYNKRCRNEIPHDFPLYPYATTGAGLKLRIHPLAAAIALDQLGHLEDYLQARASVAARICDELGALPGLRVPTLPADTRASWYGLPLYYQPDELGGLPIQRFHRALLAEGAREVDRPGSTCPINLFPLFDTPTSLLPGYPEDLHYRPGDFPRAEALHAGTLKLPVWHDRADEPLVDAYLHAFQKVITHHARLLP